MPQPLKRVPEHAIAAPGAIGRWVMVLSIILLCWALGITIGAITD